MERGRRVVMKRRTWVIIPAALGAFSIFFLRMLTAEPPDRKRDLAANAALQYWQAFSFKLELTEDEQKAVDDWKKGPPPAKVRRLFEENSDALTFLHRAAKVPHCEWGLNYED